MNSVSLILAGEPMKMDPGQLSIVGKITVAVLLASGVPSAAEADRILGQSEDNLRAALARL